MATVTVAVKVDSAQLHRLVTRTPAEAARLTRDRAVALRKDIQRRIPKDTGKTAAAIREVKSGPYEWLVTIPEVPGRFLIEGTRPHLIRPRRARVLRFAGAGGWVFSRIVRHPGTRPNPFAQQAAQAALSPFQRLVGALFGGR